MDRRQATYLKLLGIQAWCKQEDLPRIREYQQAQSTQSSPSTGKIGARLVETQNRQERDLIYQEHQIDQKSFNKIQSASSEQVTQSQDTTSATTVGFLSNQLSSIIASVDQQLRLQDVKAVPHIDQKLESYDEIEIISAQSTSKIEPPNSIFSPDFLQSIQRCTACEFFQSRQKATLPRQNQNVRVMVITDIPLKEEMYQGLVLDRQDESFFFKALSAVGLPQEALYITPFIKCRPPELRDVTAQEWQACAPILQQEINGLNPDLLFILGRNSVKFLLGQELPFDQLRGSIHQVQIAGHHLPAIISHSPRVYAHNARLKSNFWRDVKLLRRTLDRL